LSDARATPAIELERITKRFGRLVANDEVSLSAAPGEILAVVGENGAGKTTLMNVLYGIHRPDSGEIRRRGERIELESPRDAIRAGIGMVHQHFRLVRDLTVAENVVLGTEPTRGVWLDRGAAEERVRRLAAEVGFSVDPRAVIERLSVGAQQRVEILKALTCGAEVLVLDEPTAVLTPQESDELLRMLKRLAEAGKTILFVSHKLSEVTSVSTRVAVLRGGRLVATLATADTTPRELATLMVGREPVPLRARAAREPGPEVLVLDGVSANDERGVPALRDVSLRVRAGEIVGVAGVEGNGQHELVEVATGLLAPGGGRVTLPPSVGHVPGDRLRDGVVADMTVKENAVLGRHREPAFRRGPAQRLDAIREHARRLVEAFDVRPPDEDAPLRALSGGNQQKAVVARELDRVPELLVAAHPTRGVDVGAIERIHAALLAERDRGAAVLLVSSDLTEILALADRVLVLYEGRITHETAARATDERALGPYMTGAAR